MCSCASCAQCAQCAHGVCKGEKLVRLIKLNLIFCTWGKWNYPTIGVFEKAVTDFAPRERAT